MSANLPESAKTTTTVPSPAVTLDDVLVNELGQFGWFQVRSLCLVFLPIMLSAFKTDYIFTAAAIPHRCQVPECGEDGKLETFEPEWILNAVPKSGSQLSSCQRYAPVNIGINGSLDYCPENLFNLSHTISCDSYVYASENSIVYDFDLGCQDWLRALVGTVGNIGLFIGLPLTGYISDRYGRRIALIFNVVGLGLFGLIKAFSVNYTMLMILHSVESCLGAGIYSAAFIFGAEFVGPKFRVVITAFVSSMFAVGEVILGVAAWFIQPWRNMVIVIYIPCFLCISYFWLLPDSVRWLLSKKRYSEAKKVLETCAKVNKTQITQKSMEALLNPDQSTSMNKTGGSKGLIRYVITSPVLLRRVCTTPVWWLSATLIYYGLSINSTSLFDTIYLNYIMTCAIEIPGYFSAVLFTSKLGTRTCLSSSFLISAICNISFIFISKNLATIRLIVYLMGKFSISMVMATVYLYTSELYPTEFRHIFLAFSSMIGRIGSIIAPLTPVLINYWQGLPSMMFGTMGIISGLLVLTQPDTLGTKMPDTLAQAEALGKPEPKLTQTR